MCSTFSELSVSLETSTSKKDRDQPGNVGIRELLWAENGVEVIGDNAARGPDRKGNDICLVVTPPGPYGHRIVERLRARTTFGVLIELTTTAQRSLVLAAPFMYLSQSMLGGALVSAMECAVERGVRLDMISTLASLEALKSALPLAADPGVHLFRPTADLAPSKLGSHAKVLVADDYSAYVGSANLTDPGLTSNLEMGVLLKGVEARRIAEFWRWLISSEFLVPVPKTL